MQSIRITITSEKPTSVVITERRPDRKETTGKAVLATLDAIFNPVMNGKKGKECN